MAKLQAYALQDAGLDTVEANVKLGYEADCRGYHMPVEILKALGVRKLRLLSNNPEKVDAVQAAGIEVVERVPADVDAYESNAKYIRTKREKMGHLSPHFNNLLASLFSGSCASPAQELFHLIASLHRQHSVAYPINAR